MIIDSSASRGVYPVGVCFNNIAKKFQASLKIDNKLQHLGYFTTPESAFSVYKSAKEAEIKRVAQEELAAGNITKSVYDALLNWKITT